MGTQIRDIESVSPQTSNVEAGAAARPRLVYIDNLRVLLSILVIVFHLAITYGAEGDWGYQEEGDVGLVTTMVLTLFVAVCQAFFMGLFFMLSSYFSPLAYDRRGAGPYVLDRLKRLGIPLVFFQMVLRPLMGYALAKHEGFQGSLWAHLGDHFRGLDSVGDGPLWFVLALLIFSCVYALWRRIWRPSPQALIAGRAPSNGTIALAALILGVVTAVVRIWCPVGWNWEPWHFQLAHFTQYVALFAFGALAYRRNWFAGLSAAQGRLWGWIAIALVPLFPVIMVVGGALEGQLEPFVGGLHWQSLAYSIWEQFMCLAMAVALLVLFRDRLNHQSKLARTMAADAYAVYVFFAPVIVLLALALSGIRMQPGLKFLWVAPLAVALCFLVGHAIRRVPGVKRIL